MRREAEWKETAVLSDYVLFLHIYKKRCEPVKTLQGCHPRLEMSNAKGKKNLNAKVYSFMVNPTLVSVTILLSDLHVLAQLIIILYVLLMIIPTL